MTKPPSRDELKAFGEWLSLKRAFTDMTQRDVGEKVGVSWSQISRYESGEAMPRKGVLIRLQALFESRPIGLDDHATQKHDSSINPSAIIALERLAESLHQQAKEIEALATQLRESGDASLLITALNILRKN